MGSEMCIRDRIRGEHRLDGIPELPDGAESKVGSVRWPLGRGSILPIGCRWLNPSFRWGLLSVGLLSVSSRPHIQVGDHLFQCCLLYTSDAADDSLRVDLGGRRIIKKKKKKKNKTTRVCVLFFFFCLFFFCFFFFFFFQAEDGIRDRSPSRGLGDVYKRQPWGHGAGNGRSGRPVRASGRGGCPAFPDLSVVFVTSVPFRFGLERVAGPRTLGGNPPRRLTPSHISVRKATAGHLVPTGLPGPTVDFAGDRDQAFAFCAVARTRWEK